MPAGSLAQPRTLTRIEQLAVQAAARELREAQEQMRAILSDLGVDPSRNYQLVGDSLVEADG